MTTAPSRTPSATQLHRSRLENDLWSERKKLGELPKVGEAENLEAVPLKPLVDDPVPYDEEPGDSFVITRDIPPGTEESQLPERLRQYDEELRELLSDEAMDNILDIETSFRGVR